MIDVEGPPRKRIRYGDDDIISSAILADEIDFEIALRTRLRATIESRLAWALILHDALEKNADDVPGEASYLEFSTAAVDAFQATQEPSRFLISDSNSIPESIVERLLSAPPVSDSSNSHALSQANSRPRHVPRQSTLLEDRSGKAQNKYLYIRDIQSDPPMVYKLACPDCLRSNFPRLQGLLNHCRLKHGREFGNHDECIQSCACLVADEEQVSVIDEGTEVTGMSASLQRLFEIAVGADLALLRSHDSDLHDDLPFATDEAEDEMMQTGEALFVTKTLGHHKDTPALAPFLGRAVKKRVINVFSDDRKIDIDSIEEGASVCKSAHIWLMKYKPRSYALSTSDTSSVYLDDSFDSSAKDSTKIVATTKQASEGSSGLLQNKSRFHFTARLAVSDWSLRLSESEATKLRAQGSVTHKWMISVQAPAYSLHASTFLKQVTVSPVSKILSPLFESQSVSDPPFCVMGVAKEPFLAYVTFEWTGTRSKITRVEHWVDLDSGKATRPVLGDEQIIDIELDRDIELLPRRDDVWSINWHSDAIKKRALPKVASTSQDPPPLEEERRLKTLLTRFPMTMKDPGLRVVPRLPYFLPHSEKHFASMVTGRRKAIEWGRARALWEAISATKGERQQSPHTSDPHEKFVSTRDVYSWLEKRGQFPRYKPPADTKTNASTMQNNLPNVTDTERNNLNTADTYCAQCGLQLSLHRSFKVDGGKGARRDVHTCALPEWATKQPILSVYELRIQCQGNASPAHGGTHSSVDGKSLRDLLSIVDPNLIAAIEKIVAPMGLHNFTPVLKHDLSALCDTFRLSSFALMAVAVRALIRHLISDGLHALNASSSKAIRGDMMVPPKHAARGSSMSGSRKRLLTPAHIIQGLVDTCSLKQRVHSAVLLSTARMGVEVRGDASTTSAGYMYDQPELRYGRSEDGMGDVQTLARMVVLKPPD